MVGALYRRNVSIGLVAKLTSCGQVGSATLSSQILWPSVNNCSVVAHTGAYTSHQCQGLSSHNIVLLLVATL
jgi:hypothetical protein